MLARLYLLCVGLEVLSVLLSVFWRGSSSGASSVNPRLVRGAGTLNGGGVRRFGYVNWQRNATLTGGLGRLGLV